MAKQKTSSKSRIAARSKKRARFPRAEAALAGLPVPEASAEPTTAEPPPAEAPAEAVAHDPDPAEAPAVDGPTGDTVARSEVAAGNATPTDATPPETATADAVSELPAGEALTTEALAEAAGEAPAAQATTEPPTVEGAGTEATAEGAGAEGTTPDADTSASAGTASEAAPAASGTAKETDKPKKVRKARASQAAADDGTAKKLSALDAAAKVLGEAEQALGCKEMIEAMAIKGYWSSPAGRTPAGTLYAAILREIATKGDAARFQKTERGMFALRGA